MAIHEFTSRDFKRSPEAKRETARRQSERVAKYGTRKGGAR